MKYLFTAQFNDGSIFHQDPEDKHPTKENKSSFTYLLEEAEIHGGIALFKLNNDEVEYSVDLKDGHFEIDGKIVKINEVKVEPQNLELVYFRRHTHNFNVYGMEIEHGIKFDFGWKMNKDGKDYQQIITIE